MSINSKRDGITVEDLRRVSEVASMKRGRAEEILVEVTDAVRSWPELAFDAGIGESRIDKIGAAHRLSLPAG